VSGRATEKCARILLHVCEMRDEISGPTGSRLSNTERRGLKHLITDDGLLNCCFRAAGSLSRRLRGWIYLNLNVVSSSPGSSLSIGKGATIVSGKNIRIDGRVKIGKDARLECHRVNVDDHLGTIILEDGVSLGNNVHIGSVSLVHLEQGTLLGSNILITDHSHGSAKKLKDDIYIMPKNRVLVSKGPTLIRRNSWICDGAIVLAGVEVGENCIVGANSVVRQTVPPTTVVK